jgi:phosphosulfolactate phosphohydrolase-like enzyme
MSRVLTVKPISKKAKNRFANLMESNGTCIIEQIKDNFVFLRSINNQNFFWMKLKNDSDWIII